MKIQIISYVVLLVVLLECKAPTSELDKTSKKINAEPDKVKEIKEEFNKLNFSTYELSQLAKTSNEEIDMMFIKGDTLQIISDGSLIVRPFGYVSFKDSIQNHHNNIFNVEDISTKNDNRLLYNLSFKNSFIKINELDKSLIPSNADKLAEYHYKMPDLAKVISADIKNEEIRLKHNIHVGMLKSEFFSNIFGQININIFDNISIVQNLHILEESTAPTFFFKGDTLNRIEIK